MTQPRSLSDREHKRLKAILTATQPRNGEAAYLAEHFALPVATMARHIADIRGAML